MCENQTSLCSFMLSNSGYLKRSDKSLHASVWVCAVLFLHLSIASECALFWPTYNSGVSSWPLQAYTQTTGTHTSHVLTHTHTPVAMSLLRTGTGAGCVGACMNKALCKPFTTHSHSFCRLRPFNTFITKPVTLHKVKLEFEPELSACLKVK